eukprot:COSAG02_NODE_426_length_22559_cov_5.439403_4_plen_144_part_00
MHAHQPVRPSICLFVCLPVCLFTCLPACLPALLAGCLPACLCVDQACLSTSQRKTRNACRSCSSCGKPSAHHCSFSSSVADAKPTYIASPASLFPTQHQHRNKNARTQSEKPHLGVMVHILESSVKESSIVLTLGRSARSAAP